MSELSIATSRSPEARLAVVIAMVAAAGLCGCSGGDDPLPAGPTRVAGITTVAGNTAQVTTACEALRNFKPLDGTITAATLIAADEASGSFTLPQYCKVTGILEPRAGVAGVAYGTMFEIRLPTAWAERLYFQGQGGTGGSVVAAVGSQQPAGQEPALRRGFAVLSMNGGHQGSGPNFGVDPKAKFDFAYHALDISTVMAKDLLAAYYKKQPVFSYAAGCSNGGRQTMMLSQRFPTYYDGILAGSATYRLSRTYVDSPWGIQQVDRIAPRDANGTAIHANAFSDADLALVSKDLLSVLDAQDGLVDGVVSNTNASAFENYDPARLQCTGAKSPACLTAGQVVALRNLHAGARNAANERLYNTWPWDPGISHPQWRQWKLGTAQSGPPNSTKAAFADSSIGYLYLEPPEPTFSALNFNFETDPARLATSGPLMDADNPDLTPFVANGGKILWYHGMMDPSTPATEIVRYYQRMAAATRGASAADYARIFMLPGMGHCSGGPGLDSFDALDALMKWVEQGQAPSRLIASGTAVPGRTRPICAWPQWARYNGTGSVDDAASFTCSN